MIASCDQGSIVLAFTLVLLVLKRFWWRVVLVILMFVAWLLVDPLCFVAYHLRISCCLCAVTFQSHASSYRIELVAQGQHSVMSPWFIKILTSVHLLFVLSTILWRKEYLILVACRQVSFLKVQNFSEKRRKRRQGNMLILAPCMSRSQEYFQLDYGTIFISLWRVGRSWRHWPPSRIIYIILFHMYAWRMHVVVILYY